MKEIQYGNLDFLQPQNAWEALSQKEKADVMKVAVRRGITDLATIRQMYNEFAEGGELKGSVVKDSTGYSEWVNSLPDNLKHTDPALYDMLGAYEAGMQPTLEEDGLYHLQSRDPRTGRILKSPIHPTYLRALMEDAGLGYYPTVDDAGNTYTKTWEGNLLFQPKDNEYRGPIVEGANEFKGGGYKPSFSVKKRISTWEGEAMTGAKDPLSGKWGKNRSFEAEADSFYHALPESIRGKVLSNSDLADNLYSYSYNVGAGNFKKRVVPTLEKYYQGKATVDDIERSMWASGDAKLRGLRRRRAEERAGVRKALDPTMPIVEQPVSAYVPNPYILQQQATLPYPEVVSTPTTLPTFPSEVELEYQRKQQEAAENRYRFNMAMNVLKLLNGEQDPAESFLQNFMPNPSIPLFEGLPEDQYAHGGKIHIKPSHRGRLTELKKRTGKSEAELYRTGSPAVRKMITFARNSRKWKHADGGHLYGGGGLTNIILGPRPGVTDNEDVRGILSWLPYTSTAIDVDNAAKDPSAANLTWAGISTGLDALSFGMASKIKKGIKAVEKAIAPAEKEAVSATKRAERAKKVYEQAPTKKNYELNLKAEREAFEKNYVLNNQVNGLYKQLADAQWYKSTWLPIMDGHGGVLSQGAQTLYECANEKASGGSLHGPVVEAAKNLYEGTIEPTQKMEIGEDYWKKEAEQPTIMELAAEQYKQKQLEEQQRLAALRQVVATKGKELAKKRTADHAITSNDATAVASERPQNKHLEDKAIDGAKAHAAWEKDTPVMATVGLGLGAVPLAVATLPAVIPAGEAIASTATGQLATKFLTHPITEAAGVAMSGGHGLSNLFSGNANALTALELAPLAFPYGNFIKGTGEAINFVGSKIPTPIKEAWANRSEKAAMFFGDEGKTWTRVTDPKGKEGIVFLNTNNNWKTAADWLLHPQQTYRDFRGGYYPMTRKQWKNYLTEEQKTLDYAKQKSIELNDAQLKQRLSLQQESFLDNRARNNSASIKINTNPNSPFSLPRAPRNASEVANNVKVVSRDKDVSYGGKWFDPKFGTGAAAVSHPDKNVIVLPRHYQTQFSNRLTTMPGRGYTSPIDTRMHMYVHELQHQMQQNLPLLNLSQPNTTTMYYEPWDHFLSNIDSENLLLPFKETAQKYPGSWLASPNEYNAESNAYRVVDDYRGRRSILDPLDEVNASRLSGFGLNFDQIESLWNMGYKEGGYLRR